MDEQFADLQFVCLLFSGKWSPPCVTFMKNYLVPFVTEINDDGKKMEVIYISNDKSAEDFKDAFID